LITVNGAVTYTWRAHVDRTLRYVPPGCAFIGKLLHDLELIIDTGTMSEPQCVMAACTNVCIHQALDLRLSYVPDKVGVNKKGVNMILPSQGRDWRNRMQPDTGH
jgi:hypothetical protein